MSKDGKILWEDKKRPLFGLPLSFTTYKLTEEKLIIIKKFLSIKEEEIRLYKIMDITLNKNLFQRIFKVGTIHCCSADVTTPDFEIAEIKDVEKVRTLLSDLVEAQRSQKISSGEFISMRYNEHRK